MNSGTKKLLSLLVVFAMVLSMAPSFTLPVFAAGESTESEEITYGDTYFPADQSALKTEVEKKQAKGEQVAEDSAKLQAALAAGTTTFKCPHCGDDVEWRKITSYMAAGFISGISGTHHVYVEADSNPSVTNFVTPSGGAYNLCLFLMDGVTVTTSGKFDFNGGETVNVMGTGTMISTGATDGLFKCRGTTKATLNLYGGKYLTSSSAALIQDSGWAVFEVNMFDGAVIGKETLDNTSVQRFVSLYGTFNMYGGIIRNAVSDSTYGAVTLQKADSGRGKTSGRFNMYSGTITGGTGVKNDTEYWGNVYADNGSIFKMYGGTISNGSSSRTTITSASGANIYGINGANIYIYGGTVSNGEANGTGGNIGANTNCYVEIGGKALIQNGTAWGGGNLHLTSSELKIAGGKFEGGTLSTENVTGAGGSSIRCVNSTINMSDGLLSAADHDTIRLMGSTMTMSGGKVVGSGRVNNAGIRVESNDGGTGSSLYLKDTAQVVGVDGSHLGGRIHIADGSKLAVDPNWTGKASVEYTGVEIDSCVPTTSGYVGTLETQDTTAAGTFAGDLNLYSYGTLIGENGVLLIKVYVAQVGNTKYESLDDAFADANGAEVILLKDISGVLKLTDDLTINLGGTRLTADLNGNDLTLTGTGSFSGIDTANDEYQLTDGTVSVADGIAVNKDVTVDGKRYIALVEGSGVYSCHRLEAAITYVTIRTTEAGLYYKAQYKADADLLAAIDSYGVVMSVDNMPGADWTDDGEDTNMATVLYNSSNPLTFDEIVTSGSVFGIMKTEGRTAEQNAQYGKMYIYANPYLTLNTVNGGTLLMGDTTNDGKTVESEGFSGAGYSLYSTLKRINDNWSNTAVVKNEATKKAVKAFYDAWAEYGMNKWTDLTNIIGYTAQ